MVARKRAREARQDPETTRVFPSDGCAMCTGQIWRRDKQYWMNQQKWILRFQADDGTGTLIARPQRVDDESMLVLGEESARNALHSVRRSWPMQMLTEKPNP